MALYDINLCMTNSNTIYIDVRSPEEFGEYSLPGSVNVPVQNFMFSLDSVFELFDKNCITKQTHIVLYCASGARASVAEQILRVHDFSHIENKKSIYDIQAE